MMITPTPRAARPSHIRLHSPPPRARRLTLPALALAVFAALAPAGVQAQGRPPALVAKHGDKLEEMVLTKLEVGVRIHGLLAETTSTMTFHNPHDRVLEGDIFFPLPEGATVSGFALDVEGRMVDGVAVEKDRARSIFEKIVRTGIDPGLVEWARGNTFKTRIFPLPPNGERTIRVGYVSEVDAAGGGAARFTLPLVQEKPLAEFGLHVEVVGGGEAPQIVSGAPAGFEFAQRDGRFVGEVRDEEVELGADLVVALPAVGPDRARVERAADGEVYFCIHAAPPQAGGDGEENRAAAAAPRRLAVVWDASGSRGQRDHGSEITALDRCIGHWASVARDPIEIEVTVMRHRPTPGISLTVAPGAWRDSGGREQLLDFLGALPYDGASDLGAALAAAAAAGGGARIDRALLFSDGLATFGAGGGTIPDTGFRVDVLSADRVADHAFLEAVAAASGGRALNLARTGADEVVAGLTAERVVFLGAEITEGEVSGALPMRRIEVGRRHCVVGKLRGARAKLTLNYALGAHRVAVPVEVSADRAVAGEMLRRQWAQTKLADLLPFGERRRDEIVDLGKEHSIVTPFTSLLVLESLEQYLEHRVVPPRSWPEMRGEYAERIEQLDALEEKTRADKLVEVLAMWEQFCAWYDTEFEYAEDFRYQPVKRDAPAEGADNAEPAIADEATPLARHERNSTPAPGSPATTAAPAAAEEFLAEGLGGAASGGAGRDSSIGAGDGRGKAGVAITPWDPDTPYLRALKAASAGEAFGRYLELRAQPDHAASPAFFLDCAGFFAERGRPLQALQVLSNLAELELADPQVLRVLAHRLQQLGELDHAVRAFEEILKMRPEEPQSYRDLALALAARADTASERGEPHAARSDFERAITLLADVVMGHWDRFDEIEVIALVELNGMLPRARAAGVGEVPLDERLLRPVESDVRITMTWDADLTDIDLHVTEPSGEVAYYGHNRTTIGGRVSRDFTQGYGPEEYLLRRAMGGTYEVKAKFYGSQSVKLLGGVTVQVNIFTDFGRPEQHCKSITVRLTEQQEMLAIGEIEF